MPKFIFAVCISLLLAACGGKTSSKTESKKVEEKKELLTLSLSAKQLELMNIQLVQPGKKAIASYVNLNGKVSSLPNNQANISSDLEGKVEQVFVTEGNYIGRGQPVLTLRSMPLIELQNEYLNSKSEMDFLDIEFKRQTELVNSNVGALAQYQVVEAKYNAIIAKEKALRAKLETLGINVNDLQTPQNAVIKKTITISSPISGYIHKLPVKVGMLASPQSVLAEVINLSEMQADLFVYDKDINLIQEGQSVELNFINASVPNVTGRVINIERMIDSENKAITIHVKFSAPDKSFVVPGMSVRGAVVNPNDKELSYAVPFSALLKEEDNYYVFYTNKEEDKEGKMLFKKSKVKLGDRNDQMVEIQFLNAVSEEIFIVQNNPMILENERRKSQ